MASISTRNITASSFEARVTGMDSGNGLTKSITWYLDGSQYDSDSPSDTSSSSSWVYFDGLDSDTEYLVEVRIIYMDGAYWDEVSEYVTTSADEDESYTPDVDGIYIQERTPNDPTTQIAVRARGLDEDYPYDWRLYWYLYENDRQIDNTTTDVDAGDDRSEDIIFENLTPGTEYRISLRVRYEVDGSYKYYYTDDIYITTDEDSTTERPAYFEWDTKKVKGQPFNLTASEWCGLLDNINEVRVYKGYSKISSTSNSDATARFYYPSRGEKFLATMYNQCIYAFDNMGLLSYSDYRVLSGDTITADAINFLRDTINDVD